MYGRLACEQALSRGGGRGVLRTRETFRRLMVEGPPKTKAKS